MRPLILCDIDGVVADCTDRLVHIHGESKDWDAFFSACSGDQPIKHVIRFLQHLAGYFDIVYITGRPERTRNATIEWFQKYHVPFVGSVTLLLMRTDGDHRLDSVIKKELFREFIDQTRVIAVIEDRDQVVEMWRAEGLLCLQPKKGDY
jgi:hypothetical protein